MNQKLPERELLRVDEVAAYFSVTAKTIRMWIKRGLLEADRRARTTRVLRESVLKKAK